MNDNSIFKHEKMVKKWTYIHKFQKQTGNLVSIKCNIFKNSFWDMAPRDRGQKEIKKDVLNVKVLALRRTCKRKSEFHVYSDGNLIIIIVYFFFFFS